MVQVTLRNVSRTFGNIREHSEIFEIFTYSTEIFIFSAGNRSFTQYTVVFIIYHKKLIWFNRGMRNTSSSSSDSEVFSWSKGNISITRQNFQFQLSDFYNYTTQLLWRLFNASSFGDLYGTIVKTFFHPVLDTSRWKINSTWNADTLLWTDQKWNEFGILKFICIAERSKSAVNHRWYKQHIPTTIETCPSIRMFTMLMKSRNVSISPFP